MEARQLFDDAIRYTNRGTLPHHGGYKDQAPRFCAAVAVVDDVLSALRQVVNG